MNASDEHLHGSYATVRRFLRRRLDDSDDVVQETVIAVTHGAWRFRRESRFSTFLLGVAHHQLQAELRRRRRAERIAHLFASGAHWHDSTPSACAAEAREIALAGAMQRLPESLRDVLRLTFWENRRHEDVARLLGIPVGTVASRIRRAKEMLRQAVVTVEPDLG